MREYYKKVGVRQLCELFGKTRLAYYDCLNREQAQQRDHVLIIEMVLLIRDDMPNLGTAKLYYLLAASFERASIKIGRDGLHELLFNHGLTVKRRRYRPRTTYSDHWMRKYPNQIKNLVLNAPNQLWVSDITYIRLINDFSFLSLITDAYSHKIVGYYLHTTLSRHGSINALKMALSHLSDKDDGLIHHSDRGGQYCSFDYVLLLKSFQIGISMTEDSDPRENAVAERVNGILKAELGLGKTFTNHQQAVKAVEKEIAVYNQLRPHMSCNNLTPDQAHQMSGILKKRWKASQTNNWMNFSSKKEIYSLVNKSV
jgi:putative transposase